MVERGPKGLGSYRIVKRGDGSLALKMKITLNGKYYAKQIDCPPKRKIEEARAAFVTEVSNGAFDKAKAERKKLSDQPTLAEWVPVFLSQHVTHDEDRAGTKTTYANMLRLYVVPTLGNKRLSELDAPDFRTLFQSLYAHGHGKAMSTIQLAYSVVRLCLDAAIDDRLIVANPLPKFRKLKLGEVEKPAQRAKNRALTAEQVPTLLAECAYDPELHLFAHLVFGCGLRPGEAGGLRWGDVDLQNRIVHVRVIVKKVYGQPGEGARIWLGKPKTRNSARDVTFGPAVAAAIARELARQEGLHRDMKGHDANVKELRSLVRPDMCVFCEDIGTHEGQRRPLSPAAMYSRIKLAAERAGLPDVSGHWGRHTAISHALAGGAPLADVSKRAGHANPAITAAIYAHAVGEGEQKAAMIADGLLVPAVMAGTKEIEE